MRLSGGEAAPVWAMSEETLMPSLRSRITREFLQVLHRRDRWPLLCDSVQLHSEIGISSPREISLMPEIVMTRLRVT